MNYNDAVRYLLTLGRELASPQQARAAKFDLQKASSSILHYLQRTRAWRRFVPNSQLPGSRAIETSGISRIDSNQDWNYPRGSALLRGRMFALFDLYRLDPRGSAMWLGTVQSYNLAMFEIELIAARAPGDYTIVNRKTGRGAMA